MWNAQKFLNLLYRASGSADPVASRSPTSPSLEDLRGGDEGGDGGGDGGGLSGGDGGGSSSGGGGEAEDSLSSEEEEINLKCEFVERGKLPDEYKELESKDVTSDMLISHIERGKLCFSAEETKKYDPVPAKGDHVVAKGLYYVFKPDDRDFCDLKYKMPKVPWKNGKEVLRFNFLKMNEKEEIRIGQINISREKWAEKYKVLKEREENHYNNFVEVTYFWRRYNMHEGDTWKKLPKSDGEAVAVAIKNTKLEDEKLLSEIKLGLNHERVFFTRAKLKEFGVTDFTKNYFIEETKDVFYMLETEYVITTEGGKELIVSNKDEAREVSDKYLYLREVNYWLKTYGFSSKQREEENKRRREEKKEEKEYDLNINLGQLDRLIRISGGKRVIFGQPGNVGQHRSLNQYLWHYLNKQSQAIKELFFKELKLDFELHFLWIDDGNSLRFVICVSAKPEKDEDPPLFELNYFRRLVKNGYGNRVPTKKQRVGYGGEDEESSDS